jgi:hypothetical protein
MCAAARRALSTVAGASAVTGRVMAVSSQSSRVVRLGQQLPTIFPQMSDNPAGLLRASGWLSGDSSSSRY